MKKEKKSFLNKVRGLLERVTLSCLDKDLIIKAEYDKIHRWSDFIEPRVYLQVQCVTNCSKTGNPELQKGRKWYLSEFMTNDEIIRSAFGAFERFVSHEVEEGFKVDGKTLFNPHLDFEEILKISHLESVRLVKQKT